MFLTADMEHSSKQELLCISATDGEKVRTWYGYEKFLNDIFEWGNGKRVYFHFGGGYDFLYLLRAMKGLNYQIQENSLLEVGGNIYRFVGIDGKYNKVEFRDSWALLQSSQDKVCTALLGEGQKSKHLEKWHLEDYDLAEVVEACENDVVELWFALGTFAKELGRPLALTAASQAMDYFQAHYLEEGVLFPPHLAEFREIEPFVFGGHVDIYKRYAENVTQIDINSAYPYMMLRHGAPVGRPYRTFGRVGKDQIGFYVAEILGEQGNFPLIPQRLKVAGYTKLYFLNKSDRYFWLTDADLDWLDSIGCGYNILNGYAFEHHPDFFRDYVLDWYDKRMKNPHLGFIAKLMLNSLGGKFSQKIDRQSMVVEDGLSFYYDQELKIGRKSTQAKLTWFNQPQIWGWITSNCRLYHGQKLIEHKESVVYCDTDSLYLENFSGDKDVSKDKQLGKWAIEGEYDRAYFLAPKFYGLQPKNGDWLEHTKGIDKYDKAELFGEDAFKKGLKGDIHFEARRWKLAKAKTALITDKTFVKYYEASKKIEQFDLKRKLKKDGIGTDAYSFMKNKLT